MMLEGVAAGLLAALAVVAVSANWRHQPRADMSGSARVVDGDTIVVEGTRIRLWGIDAPEHDQTCEGKGGTVYECGRDATAVLRELTAGQVVRCTVKAVDRYGRSVAVCHTESGELNAAMVRRGWSVDYTQYSGGRYKSEERHARKEGLGIWAGRFEMPSEWRHRHTN